MNSPFKVNYSNSYFTYLKKKILTEYCMYIIHKNALQNKKLILRSIFVLFLVKI